MPETFDPVTLQNDTGIKLNAAYFNRLEANIETIDDRAAALERGVTNPVTVGYAASIVIDASLGSLFQVTATGNVAIADIVNGLNGQCIELEVLASGGARTVSFSGVTDSVVVAAGQLWIGEFRYRGNIDTWFLRDQSGSSTVSSSTAGAAGTYSVTYSPTY